jgi:hypothetical protein
MKRQIIPLLIVAVAALVAGGHAQEPSKVSAFMRLKLAHSQKLLEGIVLEDYRLIEKSAQDLSVLSHDELWQVYTTPTYIQHSLEFRRAADDVGAAAKKRNIDAAALSYMGLTLKCVECHKHVRDVRMAAGPHDGAALLLGRR